LGRALKLDGRRDEAFEAFAKALDLAPGSRDVIRQVVELGLTWRLERSSGIGQSLALSVTRAIDDLKSAIARLEQDLPAIRAMTAVPVEHYDDFRRLYRVPPAVPPAPTPSVAIVVLGTAPLEAMLASVDAIKDQTHRAAAVMIPALAGEAFAPARAALPDAVCLHSRAAAGAPPHAIVAATLEASVDAAWLILLREPALLDPEATGWILAEALRTSAAAVFCDEDTVDGYDVGRRYFSDPRLRGQCDPELVSEGHDLGTLLAVRRDVLALCLAKIGASTSEAGFWSALTEEVAARGAIRHVSQVLVSRFAALVCAGANADLQPGPRTVRSGAAAAPRFGDADIDVVIPTRNGLELIEACLSTLVATAARAHRLKITIVDNGSDDPDMRTWLADGQSKDRFSILDHPGPFNWSRFNNRAAEATRAPLLLFLNNDVELMAPGWDDILRGLLSRDEVGVVGARLVYPDRTLQHAGMVLGVEAVSEHEGRGEPMNAPGPLGRWQLRRSVSAVTGAFLACRRDVFSASGGFDADQLPIWFSDVDLCLKISGRGLRVLYEPRLLATHHESKTLLSTFEAPARSTSFERAADVMRNRWGRRVVDDPWYNPLYARFAKPYSRLLARGSVRRTA
jgi:GT2 family glycosyltransferase